MRQIDVTYRPALADVLHAARVAEGEAWRTASRVAAGALGVCAAWLFYWGAPVWAVFSLVLAVAEWFNLLPMSALVAYLDYRRNPKYRQEYHLTLSPEHLAFRTDTIDTTLKWEHYNRFWETNRAFVLSYGAGVPTSIPKAAFASEADLEAARTLLTNVVGGQEPGQSGAA